MNEIIIRTDKGEYFPGDNIFGVVYLNIAQVTAGRGIVLNVKGQEYFCYEYNRYKLEDLVRHIECNSVTLYEQEEPFSIGSYRFPFQIRLPTELPGSFTAAGGSRGIDQWLTKINYWIEAVVINAGSMVSYQNLVIYQCTSRNLAENTAVDDLTVVHLLRRVTFRQPRIECKFKLHQNFYWTGDSAKGYLEIINNTGCQVIGIKVKLMRSLVFLMKRSISPVSLTAKMEVVDQRVFIQPEGGPKVVWETPDVKAHNRFPLENYMTAGRRGELVVDNILIPLQGTFPSVHGQLVQCEYVLELHIHFKNEDIVKMVYPVKGILPVKNSEWTIWQAPSWARNSVHLSLPGNASSLAVSHDQLNGSSFSEFPGFQAL